jgi:hypothetical protein
MKLLSNKANSHGISSLRGPRLTGDGTRTACFTRLACRLLAILILSLIARTTVGQTVDNTVNVGLPAYASYSGSQFDSVQMNNGNLHIQIPLRSATGRGLSPQNFSLIYDNKGWQVTTSRIPPLGQTQTRVSPEVGNTMAWLLDCPLTTRLRLAP